MSELDGGSYIAVRVVLFPNKIILNLPGVFSIQTSVSTNNVSLGAGSMVVLKGSWSGIMWNGGVLLKLYGDIGILNKAN